MLYYSTSHKSNDVSLREAIRSGLAPDGGIYMPRSIRPIPLAFIRNMGYMNIREIGYVIANTMLGEDVDAATLKRIVDDTFNYDIPIKKIEDGKYAVELFHGPTMAFKDTGARFMARLLSHFNERSGLGRLNVLVATSGDSGSAVANGFLDLNNVNVHVLYPKGMLSRLQEAQFTTLGKNVSAIEVIGTVDDCQRMVRQALADQELRRNINATTANSINIARLLPSVIYYFHAVAVMWSKGIDPQSIVMAVPSGNLSNLTAGLIAKRMGLPVKRFISCHNINDTFCRYLETGQFEAQKTRQSIAFSMDKGSPSNFPRICELFNYNVEELRKVVEGVSYNDRQIASTVTDTLLRNDYLVDPHTATAVRAIRERLQPGEVGVALATAHPAKFREKIEQITGQAIAIPPTLSAFMRGERVKRQMSPSTENFKQYLLSYR